MKRLKKSAKKLTPKSKGECKRMLIQTAPPLDHKHGWYGETIEKWVALWDISPKEFWKQFGVNTCAFDEKKKEMVYYSHDVEGTIREILQKGYKRIWD
jgi:hypothetical protein